MWIRSELHTHRNLMCQASSFLYIARSCWLFLAIYSLQITRLILTPITGACLFPVPIIGVYIFGISGVNVGLPVYPENNSSTNEV